MVYFVELPAYLGCALFSLGTFEMFSQKYVYTDMHVVPLKKQIPLLFDLKIKISIVKTQNLQ